MRKLIFGLLVILIGVGCSIQQPDVNQIENAVNNSNGKTESEPSQPVKMCGNGVCDSTETCYDCSKDCGVCYSLSDLEQDLAEVIGVKYIPWKPNETSNSHWFHNFSIQGIEIKDCAWASVFIIKNSGMLIKSENDFNQIIKQITDNARATVEKAHEEVNESLYRYEDEFIAQPFYFDLGETITGYEFSYQTNWYEKMPANDYTAEKLTTPGGNLAIYFYCAPNLIIGMSPSRASLPATMDWGSLSEQEYNSLMEESQIALRADAKRRAQKLLELCRD
jgi:hypothetical protein